MSYGVCVLMFGGIMRLSLKANSHVACCAHAVPMPFPCHAMLLRVENVSFPFDLHSAAVYD